MVSFKKSVLALAAIPGLWAADVRAEFDCPVSIGSATPFREPWPTSSTWFGTEALAISLPTDGTWPTTKPGALISVKLFWYSTEFQAESENDFRSGDHLGFNARIRRLDPGPDDAVISRPNWAGLGGLGANWTILTGIDFKSAGCWEITGGYLDQSLTFVVRTIDHLEWRRRWEAKANE